MNFLMLRGEVVKDRPVQEIVFDNIKKVDDMWTQLFVSMLNKEDVGELWYWGGTREKRFLPNFTERWVPSFKTYDSNFVPDIIFCRGGFKEYHHILKKFPNAISLRYGAGRRYMPCQGFYNYNLILHDSAKQLAACKQRFLQIPSTLFIKPAADNIFYPMSQVKKEYDVCFPANAAQAFKGHKFVYDTVPSDIKLLNLGNRGDRYKYPSNVTSYRVLRKDMCKNINKCKIGIVAVESEVDSCPRVIAEMIACGLPIVVLDTVRFWKDKYINSVTNSRSPWASGELANKNNFWAVVKYVLYNLDKYNPRKYYEENFSLEIAAKFLRNKINEVSI